MKHEKVAVHVKVRAARLAGLDPASGRMHRSQMLRSLVAQAEMMISSQAGEQATRSAATSACEACAAESGRRPVGQ